MPDRLRVAQIGCGEISRAHLAGYEQAELVELAAAVDVNADAAREVGDKYDVPASTDLNEVLAREDIGMVSVATPHFTHRPIALQAFAAGKHVLMEKPIAPLVEHAQEMVAAGKAVSRKLGMWFIMRYWPHVIEARRLVQAGAIGEVVASHISTWGYKGERYWNYGCSGQNRFTDWRQWLSTAGGGILIMNTVHQIDLHRFITGLKAVSVSAQSRTDIMPVEVEDFLSATVEFDNGALGNIVAASCAPGGHDEPDRIIGTHGQLLLSNPLRAYLLEPAEGLPADEWVEVPGEAGRPDRAALVDDFAAAVLEDREPPIPGEEGVEALAVIQAAYQSACLGESVLVDTE